MNVKVVYLAVVCSVLSLPASAFKRIIADSLKMGNDVKITIDVPPTYLYGKTLIIFYALPNGNTTAQTMGKKMSANDDWHFDIQHIKAQTAFVRQYLKEDVVVAYLENSYKSWPQWKKIHMDFSREIKHIVDTVYAVIPGKSKTVYLNGHSGGGSFIFGYLHDLDIIPKYVKRISFLDSNYGYDSSYTSTLVRWLNKPDHYLSVFAYNDSIALYNGKPLVSATGGTWYRSQMMLKDLSVQMKFTSEETDSMLVYKSVNKRVAFYLKKNTDRGIYHTQQVERNGFIHSVLWGTRYDELGYRYYGERAYGKYVE